MGTGYRVICHLCTKQKPPGPSYWDTLIYKDLLTVRGSWKAIYNDSHSDKARDCRLLIILVLDREQRLFVEHVSYCQPLYGIWRKWVMTSCTHFIAERSHLQRWGLTRTYEPVCGEHKVCRENSPREAGIMPFRVGFSRVLGWATPPKFLKMKFIQIIIVCGSDRSCYSYSFRSEYASFLPTDFMSCRCNGGQLGLSEILLCR